jgi:hypothetical protein
LPYRARDLLPQARLVPDVAAIMVMAVLGACQAGDARHGASSARSSRPAALPGQLTCVYNRSDGRLIGAALSVRDAGDGANQIVTVAVDPDLDPGNIAPGTRWEITVPKNGTARPCDSRGR